MIILAEQAVDWWARGIGVAALVIAVGGLAWTIFDAVFRDKPKLQIKANINVLGLGGVSTLTCIGIHVSNTGKRPITLSGFTFDIGDKLHLIYTLGLSTKDPFIGPVVDGSHQMPKRLEEGESHTFYVPVDSLKTEMANHPTRRLRKVIVRDATTREWKKRLSKNIAKWASPELATASGTEEGYGLP